MLASVMQMQLLPAVLALAAFLVAILLTLYIVRMLFGRRIRVAGGRNRPKRLDIVDAFDLDRERQLVIVRRDNVEHLLLIGGPSDVLIEAGFERSAAAAQAESRPEGRVTAPGSAPNWPSPPEEAEAEESPRAARVAPPPPTSAGPREAQPAAGALSVEGLRRRFSEPPRPAPRPPEPPRGPAAPPAPGARPPAPQAGRMAPPPPRGPEPQQWEGPGAPARPAEPPRPSPPGLGQRPAAPQRPGAPPPLAPRPPRPAAPPPASPPGSSASAEAPPQETVPGRPTRESLESLESLEAEMARLLGRPEGQ